jgi:membrane associated rhomboid family serine protease
MHPAAVGYQCQECLKEAAGSMPRSRRSLTVGRTGPVTRVLIAVNVAVFLFEVARGGPQSLWSGPTIHQLLNMGAMSPIAVAQGQYWRLFSAMFLHIGLMHIAFNMYALYLFGTLVEEAYGSAWYAAIYFVTGFVASVASFAFGPIGTVAAGTSGAIFGVFGAWIAYNLRRRGSALAEANLRGALYLIGLNFLILFVYPGIDWRAHVGGLIAGLAAGWLAEGAGPRSTRPVVQVGGYGLLIALAVAVVVVRVHAIHQLAIPTFF